MVTQRASRDRVSRAIRCHTKNLLNITPFGVLRAKAVLFPLRFSGCCVEGRVGSKTKTIFGTLATTSNRNHNLRRKITTAIHMEATTEWVNTKPYKRRRRNELPTKMVSIPTACGLLMILLSSVAFSSAFQSPSVVTKGQTRTSNTCLHIFPGFNNDNDGGGNGNGNRNKNGGDWNPDAIFESFRNLFGNSNDSKTEGKSAKKSNQAPIFSQFFQPPGLSSDDEYYDELGKFSEPDGNDDDDDEDELPAGTSLLFRIRAKQLKPGGLRLFLMFYLMGMQNTPDQNTWRADQRLMSVNVNPSGYETENGASEPEEKKHVLEMLYETDRSGMLQIELIPDKPNKQAEIRIYRCGSRPSTSYLMQESLIVDGVLDELQNISGEKDLATAIPRSDNPNVGQEAEIAEEDRLLITDPPNAIEAARESLAFS